MILRTISASEDEIIEVKWKLKNGSTLIRRYRVPPMAVQEYKLEVEWEEDKKSGSV